MTSGTQIDFQVGGKHYQEGAIQPIEFFMSNKQLDACECNMIKYAYRHKNKNGMQDLLKVVSYAILESEFGYNERETFVKMIRELIGDDK